MTGTTSSDVEARAAAALDSARRRVSFLVELDGTIAWVSAGALPVLGWHPDDLAGRSLFELYEPCSGEYSERGFANLRRDPAASSEGLGSITRSARVRRADGSVINVESHPTSYANDPRVNGVLVEWSPTLDRRSLGTAIDAVALGRPVDETLRAIRTMVESLLTGVHMGVVGRSGDDGSWTALLAPEDRPLARLVELIPTPDDAAWDDDFVLVGSNPAVCDWCGDRRGIGLSPLRTSDGVLVFKPINDTYGHAVGDEVRPHHLVAPSF
jgi:PAS domain-containing protein